ncbi:MAG: MBL fold metallo-hydrolase [candidate division WOR-3 bacterium]|nr:MBL fold metallo-hydrolase [candidate division WOR-3 bacterium]
MAETIERLVVGPLATNCYILKSGVELAVIDPGGDAEMILDKVRELGGTVKYVIDTHGHVDHIAANREVIEATGAELLIHELDAKLLGQPDRNLSTLMGMRLTSPAPGRLLKEGDKVVVGEAEMTVLHTPGHTPGGICLLGSGYAFTGDTLFVDSIGRTDFPGASDEWMQASLNRLQTVLRKETMLYPGHGEPGTFGRALLINPFLGSLVTG